MLHVIYLRHLAKQEYYVKSYGSLLRHPCSREYVVYSLQTTKRYPYLLRNIFRRQIFSMNNPQDI